MVEGGEEGKKDGREEEGKGKRGRKEGLTIMPETTEPGCQVCPDCFCDPSTAVPLFLGGSPCAAEAFARSQG